MSESSAKFQQESFVKQKLISIGTDVLEVNQEQMF